VDESLIRDLQVRQAGRQPGVLASQAHQVKAERSWYDHLTCSKKQV
jgi:hypothetical protein